MIVAVYLLLRRGDEVLLLKRANTGYMDGNYGLVSGHVDGDELATAAMTREAMEEAGIVIKPGDLKLVHTTHKLTDGPSTERVELFFQADSWEGEITNTEPHKCDELAWYPVASLPQNTIPLVRIVIQAVETGETFSEFAKEPK